MSKPWQDFWTFAFLVTSYLFTIGLCLHLLRRPGASKAALVLAIWVVVVPAFLTYVGAWSFLWETFRAPFAQ